MPTYIEYCAACERETPHLFQPGAATLAAPDEGKAVVDGDLQEKKHVLCSFICNVCGHIKTYAGTAGAMRKG